MVVQSTIDLSCPTRATAGLELDKNIRHFARCGGNETFNEAFDLTETSIGTGMNGAVLLARARKAPRTPRTPSASTAPEEKLAAVKILRKRNLSASKVSRLLNEVEVYMKMDHVNIARLLRVFDEDDTMFLVMEYCSGGALCDRLIDRGNFSEQATADAMKQVLEAVNYCHTYRDGAICHRDLKHSNFVYATTDEDSPLKLVDFGLSRVLSPDCSHLSGYAGTLHYMAPEVIRQDKYTESCDLWSLGVIAYWLLSGEAPFHKLFEADTTADILQGKYRPMQGGLWDVVSAEGKDFVANCLQVDPSLRPTAEQALMHPWLTIKSPRKQRSADSALAPSGALSKLRDWARHSALKRATVALMVYAEGTPTCDDVRNLEDAFKLLDSDGNGKISCEELVKALQQNLQISEEEGRWIFKQIDIDGDMEIHYSEFLAAALGSMMLQSDEDILSVFERFDHDQDGHIKTTELESVLGDQFCGTATKDIFKRIDVDNNGKVCIEEFKTEIRRRVSTAVFVTDPSLAGDGFRVATAPQQRFEAAKSLLRLKSLSESSSSGPESPARILKTQSLPFGQTARGRRGQDLQSSSTVESCDLIQGPSRLPTMEEESEDTP